MGWLTEDSAGQKFARAIDEFILVCLGGLIGLLFVVMGVLAWVVFETSIQSVLRAVVEIIFG